MSPLKLRVIGNSVGLVFPKDMLSAMKVGAGDILYAVADRDGIRLVPFDPEFEQDMETAREIMKRRRAVLRELAK